MGLRMVPTIARPKCFVLLFFQPRRYDRRLELKDRKICATFFAARPIKLKMLSISILGRLEWFARQVLTPS